MVLEPGQDSPNIGVELHLDRDVSDQPRLIRAHGDEVDEPDTGQGRVAELVGVAEQLISAAHREDHRFSGRRRVERVALDLGQVERAQLLIAVLPAPDVEEISAIGVQPFAEAARGDAEVDSSPPATPLEQEQVAAVGVDVHQVWVERAHAKGRRAAITTREHPHAAGTRR